MADSDFDTKFLINELRAMAGVLGFSYGPAHERFLNNVANRLEIFQALFEDLRTQGLISPNAKIDNEDN